MRKEELAALREARTCYDHLAGEFGVALTDKLVSLGWLEADDQTAPGFTLTELGLQSLHTLGVEVAPLAKRRRCLARGCLDGTERRPHIAGSLGAALLAFSLDQTWVTRLPGTRALHVTSKGREVLQAFM